MTSYVINSLLATQHIIHVTKQNVDVQGLRESKQSPLQENLYKFKSTTNIEIINKQHISAQ